MNGNKTYRIVGPVAASVPTERIHLWPVQRRSELLQQAADRIYIYIILPLGGQVAKLGYELVMKSKLPTHGGRMGWPGYEFKDMFALLVAAVCALGIGTIPMQVSDPASAAIAGGSARRVEIGMRRAHFAGADGGASAGAPGEVVPHVLDGVPDVGERGEDPVGEVGGFEDREDLFDRVEFRAVRRLDQEGDVGGRVQGLRAMPAGAVEHHQRLPHGGDGVADVLEMPVHLVRVGPVADMPDGHPVRRTDGAEEVAVPVAEIARHPRADSRV